MLTRMVFLAALVALVLPLSAQTTAPATTAPAVETGGSDDAPAAGAVTGTVTGTDVNVRSGPSTNGAYICTKVHAPTKVTVLKVSGEWLQILPTTGCYSVIAKKFVDADTAGKSGTVNADGVWARVGGDMCTTWTAVTQFWQVHRQFNTGAKVEILGSAGDFYKITPPEGCYYWVNSRFIDLGGKKPATTEPGEERPGGSVTVEVNPGGEVVKPKPTPAVTDSAARTQFQLVEKDMAAEYKKPADQQDFGVIIAKYESIKIGDDKYLKKLIDSRIAHLQGQVGLLKEKQAAEQLARELKEEEAKIQMKLKEITIEQSKPGPTVYAATGVLMASSAFPGNEVTPKRWAVYDPDVSRVTAYVQCTTGAVKLGDYIGKQVGITGSTQYDRDLKLYIVEAKEVKVLNEEGKLPTPAQPSVRPEPKEAPPVETSPKIEIKPQTPPEPTTKPAPDVSVDGPVPPDDTPKGEPGKTPTTEPATEPATKPSAESTPLPPTGLKTADEK